MAKKKKQPIEEIKAEETVIESAEESVVEEDFTDKFITIQLMAINKLPDRAKAKRLAERVLSNRRKG